MKSKKPLSAGMQVGDLVPKLHLTRRTLAKVLEAVPDAMVVIGADGKVIRVNTRAEKLLGYSQEELLGQKPDLLMPLPFGRRDLKQRAGHRARPRLRPWGEGLELLARRRDGTKFPVEVSLSFLESGAETLIWEPFGTSNASGPKSCTCRYRSGF